MHLIRFAYAKTSVVHLGNRYVVCGLPCLLWSRHMIQMLAKPSGMRHKRYANGTLSA